MSVLENYVESLFGKYKENKQIRELKYEVLTNLEAKVADLTASGMEYNEAVNKAKESISSIDYLIDSNIKVYINKFKLEYAQISLLYFIIAWIVTIPINIIGVGILLNKSFFVCSVILGIWYLNSNIRRTGEYSYTSFINIQYVNKMRKIAWIIWGIYIMMHILSRIAIQFGSNIWFRRPIHISGPYEFAQIALGFIIPLIFVIIPLIINAAPKLILRYEVGEDNEN